MRRRPFRLPWRSSRQIRADIDDELAFHIDERIGALIATGLSAESARAQANRELGDIDDARRYIGAVDRDIEAAQRRSDLMNDLRHDIGYAVRKLRSSPAFTIAAVVTLALGIGATTAIYSVVSSVLLQPLPFPQPDRLVRLKFTQEGHSDAGTPMDLIDYRSQAAKYVGFAAMESTTGNLVRDAGDAERLSAVRVSANWFDLLRVKPLVGRFFVPEDENKNGGMTVVLSEAVWRRDFAGDSAVVGRTVRINSLARTVIGVAPAGQSYPVTIDIWFPKQWEASELADASRGARWLAYIARVKDDADITAANAELDNISVAMEKRFPEEYRQRRVEAVPLQDWIVGNMRRPLLVMLAAVILVLLIAVANVANLLLVRAQSREGEMAIRTALGAGRGRLIRQLMTESVLLSFVGCALGIAIAKVGMAKLLDSAPASIVMVQRSSIDMSTLALVAIVAVGTGVMFGLLPALHTAGFDLTSTLRAGARGAVGRRSANRARRTIVVVELALAVVLLSGAGLMLRSFSELMSVRPGFNPDGVLTMKFVLPYATYDSTRVRAVIRSLESGIAAMPGVHSNSVATDIPLDDGQEFYTFDIRGRSMPPGQSKPATEVTSVGADYLRTMQIPVVNGRGFTADDNDHSQKIFLVNEAFAKRFFPEGDAVGQSVRLNSGNQGEDLHPIVGVVGDVHVFGLDRAPVPLVYMLLDQVPANTLTLVARSNDPAALTAPARNLMREIDREVPVYSVMTMNERVAASVGSQRFYASLIAIFAGVAMILAAVGLYGVIAYAVSQRTHELGVRVALGATADRISRMVIGEGLTLAAIGVVVGTTVSLIMGRLISSLLFGVSAHDPVTLVGVAVTLAAIAALASWLPARRAGRVNPLTAIRGD